MDLDAVAGEQLSGLDPYDLLDAEAARIDAFASSLSGDDWSAPTRCDGWDRAALMAHLAATEEYHRACLDGTVGALLERAGAAGATDVHTFNALGVAERADRAAGDVLDEWRASDAATRAEMRSRDGGTMDSSVGQYPVRLQAFHVASELATHADDLGVPVEADESAQRLAWRERFSRFALAETKPDAEVDLGGLEPEVIVEGVAGRLPADDPLAATLTTMP